MNGQSEGDALNDWFSGCEVDDLDSEDRQDRKTEAMAISRRAMVRRYADAEAAKVGDTIRCAFCGKRIVKTTYHKRFCTNGKTRKGGNCKDRYWNSVDRNRRERRETWENRR